MTTEQTPEGHQDDEHAALFESEGELDPDGDDDDGS
jgi:hypothetical protein